MSLDRRTRVRDTLRYLATFEEHPILDEDLDSATDLVVHVLLGSALPPSTDVENAVAIAMSAGLRGLRRDVDALLQDFEERLGRTADRAYVLGYHNGSGLISGENTTQEGTH